LEIKKEIPFIIASKIPEINLRKALKNLRKLFKNATGFPCVFLDST
jgi:hypothetical protein